MIKITDANESSGEITGVPHIAQPVFSKHSTSAPFFKSLVSSFSYLFLRHASRALGASKSMSIVSNSDMIIFVQGRRD